jgi:low affinity Fe/Cu permease
VSTSNLFWFTRAAKSASRAAGRPSTFTAALLIILPGAISGSLFDFSETWQLVINTGTTIFTLLMVFLIQNTRNRDTDSVAIEVEDKDGKSKTVRKKSGGK